MPFPEKEYYKIIMELENEEYNNTNSNFGNSINNNPADIAASGLFGNNHYHNYAGISLFGYSNFPANTEGIGLFNTGSLFGYNTNKTGSLFGYNTNKTGSLFGNNSNSLFGNLA